MHTPARFLGSTSSANSFRSLAACWDSRTAALDEAILEQSHGGLSSTPLAAINGLINDEGDPEQAPDFNKPRWSAQGSFLLRYYTYKAK